MCTGGYLRFKKDTLHFAETSESLKAHQDEAWDPIWITCRFSALLVCNNDRCQEVVVVSGTANVEDDFDGRYVHILQPTYINPSPALIQLSPKYPTEVVLELERSFVSYWFDLSAAGNHIRIVVERLLDHLKVPKTRKGKSGKRERLPLHTRITSLSGSKKELCNALLAIKCIGNAGSHADSIIQDDVFDSLDILEHALECAFLREHHDLTKRIDTINKKKGPAQKRKGILTI